MLQDGGSPLGMVGENMTAEDMGGYSQNRGGSYLGGVNEDDLDEQYTKGGDGEYMDEEQL